jgi:o-succinylbenzoate synthase
VRQGWLIALEDASGRVGLGEATPLAPFGTETPEICEAALVAMLADLLARPERSLVEARRLVARRARSAPCAAAGVESALCDRAARERGRSLAAWLCEEAGLASAPAQSIRVQTLIGGETPEAVAEAAGRARRDGFGTFKLKLAVSPSRPDLGVDRERVSALRASVGPVARIRLDANEAWSLPEAEAAFRSLEPFAIDYIEQPVRRDDLKALAALSRLGEELGLGVAADEALLGDGLEACLEHRAARILVVKPAALGGLGPAAGLARRASREGLRVVWSTLLDGAVGRTAAVHLAAALGPVDETHGLATGAWLTRDLLSSASARGGWIPVPGGPGLGVESTPLFGANAQQEPWRGATRVFEAPA